MSRWSGSSNGWDTLHGNQIVPGIEDGRTSWDDVVLRGRPLTAMRRLNPLVPGEYLEQALAEIVAPTSQDAIAENYRVHEVFVTATAAQLHRRATASNRTRRSGWLAIVEDNDLFAVNQVTIRSKDVERRFDIVLYLNGLPVVIFELKKAGAKYADLPTAHAQLAPTCESSRWHSGSACSRHQ